MTRADVAARDERRARLAIVGLIALGVLVRLATLRSPGFPSDVGTFQAWAEHLAQVGPAAFYSPEYFSDYPPGYLYVLWIFGRLLDGELLRLAVKAASIPADVAIAALAAMLAWRHGGRASAVLAAGLWSLSPAAIFAGPFWGQIDAVGTLPLFAALIAAGTGRWATAGALAGLAAMVKPQFGIGAVVIGAGALIEAIRTRRVEPLVRVAIAGVVIVLALGAPFRAGPAELVALVRKASETYPYTSLFAFNVWSIVGDFWQPDDAFFVFGAVLLVAGLVLSCLPLWRRRDTAAFLAAGAIAACAFYFLPTRAHERYLFPAFVLLLPLAVVRARLLWPYIALSLAFAATLYFAFTRYAQNDLRSPEWLEASLFSRSGQIAIALVMLALAGLVAWRLVRGEARLDRPRGVTRAAAASPAAAPSGAWRIPAALRLGHAPTRRDVTVALLVALAVLLTRGYRLDHPRDMYFDEVYHARTAFELLAQRDPYEWTHPHLAKEIMALGILAFGGDRVVGHEAVSTPNMTAFAVGPDGTRASATSDGSISVVSREGQRRDVVKGALGVRALVLDRERIVWVTDSELFQHPLAGQPSSFQIRGVRLPVSGPVTALAMAGGRVAVGTGTGVAIYTTMDVAPIVLPIGAVAIATNTDGGELYVVDPRGDVRVVEALTGKETRQHPGGGPARAVAHAQAPNRLFVARADTPALDVYDLPSGQRESVALGNARTGSFASGATALVVVPRTQFLYAVADGRVVVVEVHGASPFAAIPVSGSLLAVDNEDDKLLVAGEGGAQRIETGRHALAWRIPGVALGAVLAFFLVLLARRLFASALVPPLVGAAVVLDGSMFAQARIGMNDVYVTTFIVAAWYFIVAAHNPRRWAALDVVIAGVLLGLGVASKWAAVYTLGGVFVLAVASTALAYERGRPGGGGPFDLLAGRGRNAALLFGAFAVIPLLIYLASYARWFGGSTAPYGWNLWELTQQMYWYHSSLTSPHCAGSPWWSWPLDMKPVYWYFAQSDGGNNGYIYDAGNVVLYWAALPAAALTIALAIRTRSWSLGLVSLAMLAQYVAWIPISRVLFFYHFFTALPFYLLSLAAVLAVVWERSRRSVLVVLGCAVIFFVVFYPYISGVPIPGVLGSIYEILPTWHYDPTFYPTDSCPTHVSASPLTAATVVGAWIVEGAVLVGGLAVALGLPAARRALGRLGF
ncbi:MAG TPA: phospholipid carrier-dependent glycosyltransferase [Candidatus Limnocylindria bacterium]|nr:phospholipid carrier-dependent glycosyltransferase [Candidatus Limnocylindria bacterium]